jgi:pimeloyl-ACP methyl ester carboxylesterase
MHGLGKKLEQVGYQVVNIGYPSRKYGVEQLSRQTVGQALRHCNNADKIHFVTHSMGGILLRCYLSENRIATLGRTVMLSPPNHGSELVDRLGRYWWFRWFNGPAGLELGTDSDSIPNRLGRAEFPLAVITGNRSWDPLLSRLIARPNDGKVSEQSARLAGMADFLSIPCGHTFIMNNRLVQEQICCFLDQGRFC